MNTLTFPLPFLHPDTNPEHLAVARGEAWVDPDGLIRLPPGRRWGDGWGEPLWQWPPRLQWPPPQQGTPAWERQQITLDLSQQHRTGWVHFALKRTCANGIQLLSTQNTLPKSALLSQIHQDLWDSWWKSEWKSGNTTHKPPTELLAGKILGWDWLVNQRDRLQRLLELGAPQQLVHIEYRALQQALCGTSSKLTAGRAAARLAG